MGLPSFRIFSGIRKGLDIIVNRITPSNGDNKLHLMPQPPTMDEVYPPQTTEEIARYVRDHSVTNSEHMKLAGRATQLEIQVMEQRADSSARTNQLYRDLEAVSARLKEREGDVRKYQAEISTLKQGFEKARQHMQNQRISARTSLDAITEVRNESQVEKFQAQLKAASLQAKYPAQTSSSPIAIERFYPQRPLDSVISTDNAQDRFIPIANPLPTMFSRYAPNGNKKESLFRRIRNYISPSQTLVQLKLNGNVKQMQLDSTNSSHQNGSGVFANPLATMTSRYTSHYEGNNRAKGDTVFSFFNKTPSAKFRAQETVNTSVADPGLEAVVDDNSQPRAEQPQEKISNHTLKDYLWNNRVKRILRNVGNYTPVFGAVVTKDALVDKVVKSMESRIEGKKIDGKELHEVMYQNGVNNETTRRAIRREIEARGITIDGKIESQYLVQNRAVNLFNNIGIGKYKIGNIGGGLQIYRGKDGSKWDAIKRNTNIGGEVSALLQASVLGAGAYLGIFGFKYQGLSATSRALEDKLIGTRYQGLISHPLALLSAYWAFSSLMNSGAITAAARSANNLYSASSGFISKGLERASPYLKNSGYKSIGEYIERVSKGNGKLAYLTQMIGNLAMLGTLEQAAASLITQSNPEIVESIKRSEGGDRVYNSRAEPAIQHQQTANDLTPSQLEELAKNGWKDVGDGKFEYKLTAEDAAHGRGISQILMESDRRIGSDHVISPRESGLLAHQVATTYPSQVHNVGNGKFGELTDPSKYVVRPGASIFATEQTIRALVN